MQVDRCVKNDEMSSPLICIRINTLILLSGICGLFQRPAMVETCDSHKERASHLHSHEGRRFRRQQDFETYVL